MKPYTMAQQMARFGIPETESGPFVVELRAVIARKLTEGMIYMSAGTMMDGFYDLPYEEQARERLAFQWALDQRHSYRTEVMDSLCYWSTDTRTMKRTFHVRWRSIPAWICDRFRQFSCKWRIFRDRKILRLVNPYS